MISYNSFTLENGLKVLVHEDNSTPMTVLNVLYDVGARDENPGKTGFAHLFEHLMFGGSIHIEDYDEPLQRAGGENNAYTTNDITNYYCQLPAENIETAFWLESDRMLSLAFSDKSLDTQRKVVCEEFKEHYINKPYGNAWHKLRHLSYTTHPYKWMTIGEKLEHIEQAQLSDVRDFFFKHYCPENAVLVVAGNIKTAEAKRLAEKWFQPIPSGKKYIRILPQEPLQTVARREEVYENVPLDAFYKTWHMPARMDAGYYASDCIAEIVGGSTASRLYERLVKEKKLFSSLDCFHFDSVDKGLMTITGKLVVGVSMQSAEQGIEEELHKLKTGGITAGELTKLKNKTETITVFENMSLMHRAASLAMYELLGNANMINEELDKYNAVTAGDILHYSKEIFREENSNTLLYYSNN